MKTIKAAKIIADSIAANYTQKGIRVSTHYAEDIGVDDRGHNGRVYIIHHKDDKGEGDFIAVSCDKNAGKYVVSHTLSVFAGYEAPTKLFDAPTLAIAYGREIMRGKVVGGLA